MGIDIHMWKEEVLEQDSKKGETIIKKTDMFWGGGWKLGTFLQETFEFENCVRMAVEPEEVLEKIDEELKELNYSPEDKEGVSNMEEIYRSGYENNGYKEQLKVLQEAVAIANKDTSKAEYQWELWW